MNRSCTQIAGTSQIEIRGSLLARNALFNLLGQVVVFVVGLVTIPPVVRGLGPERFGLLSLTWAILGYFAIFDLGLGRAATKFVAEALGKGRETEVPCILWTAASIQAIFGLIAALLLFAVAPLIVEQVLKIPSPLVQEAKLTFRLIALSIPVSLISTSFSGLLEAYQRFDLLNAVRVPSLVSFFLSPLLGLILGFHLPGIMALILTSRILTFLFLLMFDFRVLSRVAGFPVSLALFPLLLAYSRWVIITSVVGPILVYLDRFLIGSLLSVAAVAYYTAPYEAVTRLWSIPGSVTMTLFPAFSVLEGIGDLQKLGRLFARSVNYILIAMGPIAIMLFVFSDAILQTWLGRDFALHSAVVLRILALGVLFNSLALVPYTLLLGIGRPDIMAKFHLLELPLYIGGAWILVQRWGIAGAAAAWSMRVALDAFLLFAASAKNYDSWHKIHLRKGPVSTLFALSILSATVLITVSFVAVLQLQVGAAAVFASLFFLAVWRYALDVEERALISRSIRRLTLV